MLIKDGYGLNIGTELNMLFFCVFVSLAFVCKGAYSLHRCESCTRVEVWVLHSALCDVMFFQVFNLPLTKKSSVLSLQNRQEVLSTLNICFVFLVIVPF